MTGTVGPVRHVTVGTVLPTPGALRDLTAKNGRLDARLARVRPDDRLRVRTVVTHVTDVKPASIPTDDPVRRRAERGVDRATVRALRQVGGQRHGLRANSPQKS
jgi:hypothetical protein